MLIRPILSYTIFDRITEELLLNKDTAKAVIYIDSLLIMKDPNWTSPILNYKIDIRKIYLVKGEYKKYYEYFLKFGNILYPEKETLVVDPSYIKFKKTKYYRKLTKLREDNRIKAEETTNSRNKERALADKINYADQNIRWNLDNLNKFNLSDSLRNEIKGSLLRYTDSCDTQEFILFYKNSATFDYIGVNLAFYIHVFSLCKTNRFGFNFIDSMLRKNIFMGRYQPEAYSWILDNSLVYRCGGLRQKYGTILVDRKTPYKINDIENVDYERRQIGLQPLWMDALIRNYQLPEDYKIPEEGKKYYK